MARLAWNVCLKCLKVVISDYPEKAILGNIRQNAERSIQSSHRSRCSVEGFKWGDFESEFAIENENRFGRIIAADCFWMPSKHEALVQSMLHFLDRSVTSSVLVLAGLHTGRSVVAGFLDTACSLGLGIEHIHEEDNEGMVRDWQRQRNGGLENITERSRWLVVARLRRKSQ